MAAYLYKCIACYTIILNSEEPEIKSFLGASAISEFHTALGQFMNYRAILRRKDPKRRLYLAVPSNIFDEFFQLEFTQVIIQDYQLSLVIYDVELEEILQWQT